MIELNEEEKRIVNKFFNNRLDLSTIGNGLFEEYPEMIEFNDDGSVLQIVNDYYIDNDKYEEFNNSKEEFIKNNYKDLLYVNENKNCKYQIQLMPHDTSRENFVKNGSLVLKVNKIIDYNGYLDSRLDLIEEFDSKLKELEEHFTNQIGVPVRILSKEIQLEIKEG